ncbi:MAG: Ada metal-binding domain-containing protein [Deltaproteobacteria bacterium]|nr:Ada metal-binding domain-containing protein [Deltaproteobacteria bacterium]
MPRGTADQAPNQEQAAGPEIQSPAASPAKPAPRDREVFYQRFEPYAGSSRRSRSKIIRLAAVICLVIVASGAGYVAGRHYWTGQAHLQAQAVKTRQVLICDAQGKSRAVLGEQDGIVRLELCDASGITRASISLGADAEPRFSLFDKEQRKLKEWEWAAAAPASAEPVTEGVASSAGVDASKPRISITSTYIGSKTSNKYHFPNCQWGKQIVPEKLLIFNSVQEARDKGYIQCRACRPPLEDRPEDTVKTAEIPLPQEFGKMSLPQE